MLSMLSRCTTPTESTALRGLSGCGASRRFVPCSAAAKDKARNTPGLAEHKQPGTASKYEQMQGKGGKKENPKTTQFCVFASVNYSLLLASICPPRKRSKSPWPATFPMEQLPRVPFVHPQCFPLTRDTAQERASCRKATWPPPHLQLESCRHCFPPG